MNRLKYLEAFLSGHVPMSSLVCSIDGDDPNAGGGAPPNTPAAPASPPGNGTPTITPEIQALIDRERADATEKAKNSTWKAAREKYEKPGTGGQPPTPPKNDPPGNAGQDALAILRLRDDFDDAISDLTLTGPQKKFVRELVMKERPADVADYVSNLVGISGWNTKPSIPGAGSPPPSGAPTPPPAPSGPPVTAGPPPSPPAARDDIPFHAMSPAQRDAYTAKYGAIATKNKIFADMANVRIVGVRR